MVYLCRACKFADMMLRIQVAAKCDAFMCYGPLVEDGYACCYNPRKEDIIFAISAFRSCKETNSSVFKETLEYSLDDMKNLFLSA